jgi:uncharacterized protein (DUF111 family)
VASQRVLYLDIFAGISGDMMLGALLDLGVSPDPLHAVVGALGLEREVQLEIEPVARHQIAATRCRVILAARTAQRAAADSAVHQPAPEQSARGHPLTAHEHEHQHDHEHPHPPPVTADGHHHVPERPYRDIVALLDRATLTPGVRARAQRAFRLLAEAEARVHRVSVDAVAFHEVGAADSLVDFVGAAALIEALAPDQIVCSPLPLARAIGRGSHGALPIPAPATVNLLQGVPVIGQSGPDQSERVTPTGAALVVSLADSFGAIPAGRIAGVGYGAGQKEFASVPNLLRVILLTNG